MRTFYGIHAICKNPACRDPSFPLPKKLNPYGPFRSFEDADKFIDGLRSGDLATLLGIVASSEDINERLRRHLAEAVNSNTFPALLECPSCKAIAKTTQYDYVIKETEPE